jgi:hypothetical protein
MKHQTTKACSNPHLHFEWIRERLSPRNHLPQNHIRRPSRTPSKPSSHANSTICQSRCEGGSNVPIAPWSHFIQRSHSALGTALLHCQTWYSICGLTSGSQSLLKLEMLATTCFPSSSGTNDLTRDIPMSRRGTPSATTALASSMTRAGITVLVTASSTTTNWTITITLIDPNLPIHKMMSLFFVLHPSRHHSTITPFSRSIGVIGLGPRSISVLRVPPSPLAPLPLYQTPHQTLPSHRVAWR